MIPFFPKSFTAQCSGSANVLKSKVFISPSSKPGLETRLELSPDCKQYSAIWDTGATGTLVTQKVVDECKLSAIGLTEIHTPSGTARRNTFLVNIWLPNHVVIPEVTVVLGDLEGGDVLIGMDIIGKGDFAVTNLDGKTTMSFRFPSVERIDFVKNPYKPKPSFSIPGKRRR
jgi:predicted aspartyl protease